MTIAERFIKNIKVLADKSSLSQEEIRLVVLTVQEMAVLSVVEAVSLLDNIESAMEIAGAETSQDELDSIRKELFEE